MSSQIALGIDISQGQINMALLKKAKHGFHLLKSASAPVPDGAIKDGNIEDAAKLARAIKDLKSRNRIRAKQVAVSLLAKPLVMQIIDMPKQLPADMAGYVQNEVRRCVVLSGKQIAVDFCAISGSSEASQSVAKRIAGGQPSAGNRIFAAATEVKRSSLLAGTCLQARVNITAIEPALPAYIRAFYAKKIKNKLSCNVLLAVVRDQTLTLSVIRKQNLDFIRIKDIASEIDSGDKLLEYLGENINTILGFYAAEVTDAPAKWEITVVADGVELPPDAADSLSAEIGDVDLQVRTLKDAFEDTPIDQGTSDCPPSPVAIGLAMKLLDPGQGNFGVNLIPPETSEVKAARRDVLITANAVAAMVLLLIVAVAGLGIMAQKISGKIEIKKQSTLLADMHALFRKKEGIEKRIRQLSVGPKKLNKILNLRQQGDWPRMLDDIRKRTPKTLWMTDLIAEENMKLSIEGHAFTYEAIHLFVAQLEESKYIKSATLIDYGTEKRRGGAIRYNIQCSVVPKKEK